MSAAASWSAGSVPPLTVMVDAKTISGSKAIIFSTSGVIISTYSIPSGKPARSFEFASTKIILSPNPNSTKTSVIDGANEIMRSVLSGMLISLPAGSIIVADSPAESVSSVDDVSSVGACVSAVVGACVSEPLSLSA